MKKAVLLGRHGEDLAAAYLQDTGHTILEKNWRCPHGEIDLVVQAEAAVAIVEVKTRSGLSYGHPFESITVAKLHRLRLLAGHWAHSRSYVGALRLDAVSVLYGCEGAPHVEHLKGVGQ